MNQSISPSLIEAINAEPVAAEEAKPKQYWTTFGATRNGAVRHHGKAWTQVFRSKEEAEAESALPRITGWEWDGSPAVPCTVADLMRIARKRGNLGVRVKGYDHDTKEWFVVAEYPVSVPLRGDE